MGFTRRTRWDSADWYVHLGRGILCIVTLIPVPEKAGQGSSRPNTAQESRPSSRPSTSTTRRPASAAVSSGFKVPQPPAASSSSSRLTQGREERQVRHGKAPARVIDLEPPVQAVAALEMNDENLDTDEGRRLDGVPLEVQEAWICEDLIFVLQAGLCWSSLRLELTVRESREA